MDVPLWLYLVSTFGVAGVGLGGVMLSNRSHARQNREQLRHDQAMADMARRDEHDRWMRERRHDAYSAHLSLMNRIDQFINATAAGLPAQDPTDEFYLTYVSFELWASESVKADHRAMSDMAVRYLKDAQRRAADDSDHAKRLFELTRDGWDIYRKAMSKRMRDDLRA